MRSVSLKHTNVSCAPTGVRVPTLLFFFRREMEVRWEGKRFSMRTSLAKPTRDAPLASLRHEYPPFVVVRRAFVTRAALIWPAHSLPSHLSFDGRGGRPMEKKTFFFDDHDQPKRTDLEQKAGSEG